MRPLLLIAFASVSVFAVPAVKKDEPIRKIVFTDAKIEGKVRRPHLVVIKAIARPIFSPLVTISAVPTPGDLSDQTIDRDPYASPFLFDEGGVRDVVP